MSYICCLPFGCSNYRNVGPKPEIALSEEKENIPEQSQPLTVLTESLQQRSPVELSHEPLRVMILKMLPLCIDKFTESFNSFPNRLSTAVSLYSLSDEKLDLSNQLILRTTFNHSKGYTEAYNMSLIQVFLFKACVQMYMQLTGKKLEVHVIRENYSWQQIRTVNVLPETFEDFLFKLIPDPLKHLLRKVLLVEEEIPPTLIMETMRGIIKNDSTTNPKIFNVNKFSGKYSLAQGEVTYRDHPTSVNNFHAFPIDLEDSLNRLTVLPFSKFSNVLSGRVSIEGAKVRKGDEIKPYLTFKKVSDKESFSSALSIVTFGAKLFSGKRIAYKRDKGRVQTVEIEARKLNEIHDEILDNLDFLVEKYPEGFVKTKKGWKIALIQSRPVTFLFNSELMITPKCDDCALKFRLSYNEDVRKIVDNFVRKDHELLLKVRSMADNISRGFIVPDLEKSLEGYNQELMECYKKTVEIRKNAISDEVLKQRQKNMMVFCLKLVIAIAILHALRRTHGDLKPENIFLLNANTDPSPVVGDLYTARKLKDHNKYPTFFVNEIFSGLNSGTESFISQQSIRDIIKAHATGQRKFYNYAHYASDYFPLSCLLYYLLTGIRHVHSFALEKNLNGKTKACVVPCEKGFQDHAFLLLPQDIQDIMRGFMTNDKKMNIDMAVEVFRKHANS